MRYNEALSAYLVSRAVAWLALKLCTLYRFSLPIAQNTAGVMSQY
jgi:hypothetical protein